MLGKTGLGELGIIQSTVGMLGVFAGFGLGVTATKHVAEFRCSDPERTGRIIALSGLVAMATGALMSLGLFVFAPWLAENMINAPHLIGVVRIGALILLISALNGAQTGVLSGFEAFRTIAKINLTVGLISFPILLGGAYFGRLSGAVWGLAINQGIAWLCNHLALRKEARGYRIPLTLRGCNRELSVLWRFSLPAVLAGSMVGPISWLCNTVLVNQRNGYAEMGIFSAANQWYTALLLLPSVLGQVLLPVLAERFSQNQKNQIRGIMALGIKANALAVFPIVLLAGAGSRYIMRLYGEGFRNGWPTLVVVLLTTGIVSVQIPVAYVIAASGKMWLALLMNMGWGLAFLAFTYLLRQHGAFGLGLARCLAYVLHAVWTFGFAVSISRKMRNGAATGFGQQ
jgi:O-antigen/teichoic acid export membrane protein